MFNPIVKAAGDELSLAMTNIETYLDKERDDSLLVVAQSKIHKMANLLTFIELDEIASLAKSINLNIANQLEKKLEFSDVQWGALIDALTGLEVSLNTCFDEPESYKDSLEYSLRALTLLAPSKDQEITGKIAGGSSGEPGVTPTNIDEEILVTEEVISAEVTPGDKLEVVDPDIFSVFKEEVVKEVAVIQQHYAAWKKDAANTESLEIFRRSFHTIKGCGYMVEATTLGDFAKSTEGLLNELIRGGQQHSSDLIQFLDDSVEYLSTVITNISKGRDASKPAALALNRRASEMLEAANAAKQKMIFERATEPAVKAKKASRKRKKKGSGKKPGINVDQDVLPRISGSEVFHGMDDTLREIFIPESETHIKTIWAFIDQAGPSSYDISEDLLKAIHTLHGSSHLAGVDFVSDLSGEMEKYCNQLFKLSGKFDQESLLLLRKFATTMSESIRAINREGAAVPDWETVLEDIKIASSSLLDTITRQHSESNEEKATENSLSSVQGFLEQAVNWIGQLNQRFHTWQAEPGSRPVVNNFVNILGELRQEASSASLNSIVDLVTAMEALLSAETSVDAEKVVLIRDSLDLLEDILDSLHLNLTPPDVNRCVEKLLCALDQNDSIDHGREDSASTEMLELFLDQVGDILTQLEDAHSSWVQNSSSREAMAVQLRHLHTLKGNASMAGLTSLTDLSHNLESLFENMMSGQVAGSQRLSDLIRTAFDGIQMSVELLHQNKPLPGLDQLSDAIKTTLDDCEVPDDLSIEALIRTAETESLTQVSLDGGEDSQIAKGKMTLIDQNESSDFVRSVTPPPPLQAEEDTIGEDKRVRVLSRVLDNLINRAGEINISQAQLGHQNTAVKFNLSELENTIARLKRQLDILTLETETQILSRNQDQHKDKEDEEFDPLELDRYSTLHQVSRALSETVNDLFEIGETFTESLLGTDKLLLTTSRGTQGLLEDLLKTQLVPFKLQRTRFERVVRRAAESLGKKCILQIEGAEGQIDRDIFTKMISPIEHLLRNAVAHGIESPAVRKQSRKTQLGKILLSYVQEYSNVEIIVSDDGAGLDVEKIRNIAIDTGLISPDANVSPEELYQFILNSRFSTVAEVSQLAGRGVGLDVVLNEVQQLGGTMTISSTPGKGCRFSIRLPSTLDITEALMVNVSDEVYAIPHGSVDNVIRVSKRELLTGYLSERPSLTYGGEDYDLYHLGSLLGFPPTTVDESLEWLPVMLVKIEQRAVAVQLERLLGTSKVKVQSIGEQVAQLPWFLSGTILPDGKIALLLDIRALVLSGRKLQVPSLDEAKNLRKPTIMIVDDSITVRKVTSKLFERQDMNVLTAKDGMEAVALLQDHKPNIMLLDIEMPRMNGYELAQQMNHSAELRDIPIIMITSRAGENHRKRALALGVEHHFGKPFKESELLETVGKLLKENEND